MSNKPDVCEFKEVDLNHPIDFMRFTLIYDGPLPSPSKNDNRVDSKQAIRGQLHPQLEELWNTHPALEKTFRRWVEADKKGESKYRNKALINTFPCGNFRFLPLVTTSAYLMCELDILFLRQEEPKGRLINQSGDLDNRLKVLFDALRMPKNLDEIPPLAKFDDPCFCLLEDDKLISRFRITSDKLLESYVPKDRSRVRLVISVNVKVHRLTRDNMAMGGD